MSDAWLVKRCSACRTYKPVSEFHRWRDGYQPGCMACREVYDRVYTRRTLGKKSKQVRERAAADVA